MEDKLEALWDSLEDEEPEANVKRELQESAPAFPAPSTSELASDHLLSESSASTPSASRRTDPAPSAGSSSPPTPSALKRLSSEDLTSESDSLAPATSAPSASGVLEDLTAESIINISGDGDESDPWAGAAGAGDGYGLPPSDEDDGDDGDDEDDFRI